MLSIRLVDNDAISLTIDRLAKNTCQAKENKIIQPLEPARQQVLMPVPSPDKWGGLAAGRASGYKNYAKPNHDADFKGYHRD